MADGWYDLATVPTTDPAPPLQGFIAPEPGSITVLYGDGGSGKGTLAAYWCASIIAAGGGIGIIDAEGHPREWARRIGGFLGRPLGPREAAIWHPLEPTVTLDDCQGLVDLLVVDSAGYFTGDGGHHDEWARSATYMQAQARAAGVPMVVLAHTPNDGKRIYGSRFWHNAARVSLLLEQEDGAVTMTCTKATDQVGLSKGSTWSVQVAYQGITPTSCDITQGGLDMPSLSTEERIRAVLADGGWHTVTEMAIRQGGTAEGYRKVLVNAPWAERRDVDNGRGQARAEYRVPPPTTL